MIAERFHKIYDDFLFLKHILQLIASIVITISFFTVRGVLTPASCPEGEMADRFLQHFTPEHPKGIPGDEAMVT